MTHECHESANPRHYGYCDCGQAITTAEPPRRNLDIERQLLADAEEMLLRAYNERAPHFSREFFRRMAKGAEEYGENAFFDRDDLIPNALEEPPDVAGWLNGELQRRKLSERDEDWQELRVLVAGAVAKAMSTEVAVRRVQEFLFDLDRSR